MTRDPWTRRLVTAGAIPYYEVHDRRTGTLVGYVADHGQRRWCATERIDEVRTGFGYWRRSLREGCLSLWSMAAARHGWSGPTASHAERAP